MLKLFGRKNKQEEQPERTENAKPAERAATDMPLPDFFPKMRMEVLTTDNRLIFVGTVEKVEKDGIRLVDEGGAEVPYVEYNQVIKLRGSAGSKTFTLEGMIGGSAETFWKVDRMRTLQIEERRQYFRQSISIECKVMCVNNIFGAAKEGQEERPEGQAYECRLIDLSAGGTMIACKESFEEGDWLFLMDVQVMEDEPAFSFTCRIRRKKQGEGGGYEYGCQFSDLDEQEHERLIRSVLLLQRKALQARRASRE